MKKSTVALLLAVALTSARAAPYDEGVRHLEAKDYGKAAAAFRIAAAEGVAAAERQLGFMYYKGLGHQQSDGEAVAWFERAAANGDLQSQLNLGQMYENGLSVPQNDARSAHWYRMAAEQDDRRAQFRTGEIYYLGTGVPKNGAEAVKWWKLALRVSDGTTAELAAVIAAPLARLSPEARDEGQRLADEWLAARSRALPQRAREPGA